jgi:hypothetical protein
MAATLPCVTDHFFNEDDALFQNTPMKAAWFGRMIQAKRTEIWTLHQQLRSYALHLQAAQQKITHLPTELADARQHDAKTNPLHTPGDRIFLDLLQNRTRPKTGRRYSPETFRWAWAVHQVSPAAWALVHDALPVPCERWLRLHFAETGIILAEALTDLGRVGELVDRWNHSHSDTSSDRRVVLSVDAVAFRPRVTISSDGSVDGLEDITQLEESELFEQYLLNPQEFTTFVRKYWSKAYSALFAFQIQPLLPHLPCCIIHAWPHCNGKGDAAIVKRLLTLREVLQNSYNFTVVGLAFDGDSADNDLHRQFKADYEARLSAVPGDSLSETAFPAGACLDAGAIICDPKHLVKRLRYRFVRSELSIGFGAENIPFSLTKIQAAGFLAPVVFENSAITKMHDALPLQLFSPITFGWILATAGRELVSSPWCLLTAALTLPHFNTKTRCHFLEIGFWFLSLYERLMHQVGLPRGITQKSVAGNRTSLYSNNQIRDGLNTFVSLISIIRESRTALRLDRLGSDPLEHSFGQARTRCHDVNTMDKMLKAFAYKADLISKAPFLQLLGCPRRRHSMGIICGPWSDSPPSELTRPPFEIAVSMFDEIGIDVSRVLVHQREAPRAQRLPRTGAWAELTKFDVFSTPWRPGTLKGTVFTSFFGHRHEQGEEHERLRVLSSDQLFLGIIKSPRPEHLQTSPNKMGKVLGTAYPQIESALAAIHGRRLNLRELESRIHIIAHQLDMPGPRGRTREDYLNWLNHHSPQGMELLQALVTDSQIAFIS